MSEDHELITATKDFIGNSVAVNKLRDCLKKHSKAQLAKIALVGPTGSGKTVLVKHMAKELGYTVIELSPHISMKQIEDELASLSSSTTIESFFMPMKKMLFVDDIDILLTTYPRLASFIGEWFDKKTPCLKPAFVCTVHTHDEKKLGDFKKHLEIIKLGRPATKDMLAFFMNYCDESSISYDSDKLLELIRSQKHDVRAVYQNLTQLEHNKEIQTIRSSFSDNTLFEIQDKLFSRQFTKDEMSSIVYSDSKLLGLLLYENVPVEMQKNRQIKGVASSDLIDDLRMLTKAYVFQDKLETYMNINVNWDMLPLMNWSMFSTVGHIVHKHKRVQQPKTDFEFTSMMTKTAMRFQFSKKRASFLNEYNLSPTHFEDAVLVLARYMSTRVPKECTQDIPKDIVDVAVKWGSDNDIITATKGAAWKRCVRKREKDSGRKISEEDGEDE